MAGIARTAGMIMAIKVLGIPRLARIIDGLDGWSPVILLMDRNGIVGIAAPQVYPKAINSNT